MDTNLDSLVRRAEATIQTLARGDDLEQVGVDGVLLDIEAAMQSSPMARAQLGPLMGRLRAARKASLEPHAAHWVAVGGGHLAIGPRPKLRSLSALRRHGATHVLTLLSAVGLETAAIGHFAYSLSF